MRIVCLNQDAGVGPERQKGAATHLLAMRRAFESLGAEVLALDESSDEALERRFEEHASVWPIDLVYERYALGKRTGARLAAQHGVPHVLEVNAPLIEEEQRWRGGASRPELLEAERALFGQAEHVLCVSEGVAEYARGLGATAEAILVRPNGFDPDSFRPRPSADPLRAQLAPAECLVVGFHGRLRPWHGFELIVRAASLAASRGIPLHLLTVGSGDFAEVVAAELDGSHHTHVPWVEPHEVGRYVATFDVLPLAYEGRTKCYFSPLKLREAMACGVVPIVPAVGELGGVVRNEENGLVYPAGDEGALANALARCSRDADLRARLGKRAVESVSGTTWKRIAEDVFGRTLASIPTRGRVR